MSAFSLSCQILVTFEAHWPMKHSPQARARLGGGGGGGSQGGDLTLNSLLKTWLAAPIVCSLSLPRRCQR